MERKQQKLLDKEVVALFQRNICVIGLLKQMLWFLFILNVLCPFVRSTDLYRGCVEKNAMTVALFASR